MPSSMDYYNLRDILPRVEIYFHVFCELCKHKKDTKESNTEKKISHCEYPPWIILNQGGLFKVIQDYSSMMIQKLTEVSLHIFLN